MKVSQTNLFSYEALDLMIFEIQLLAISYCAFRVVWPRAKS